ncbi:ribonuclease H family protein [Neorhizobium sp. DT-125]|uniref:ribonuclease H family protein n=1 Tax=Neorhizobium sp. DT-125 TaxID=3396163 RepID=UPI003F1A721B
MSYKFPFKQKNKKPLAIDHGIYQAGLHLFADGACEPNPGPGGWAFVVYKDGQEIHAESGGSPQTTNNIMEMTGALRALEWLARSCPDRQASLHCDSQYVVNGCNDWRLSWKSKAWKRGKGEVKNLELWQLLDAALERYPLRLTWCKGHAGITGNERADALSVEAMRNVTVTLQTRSCNITSRDTPRNSAEFREDGGDYLTRKFREIMKE